jgi:hypothetical protein
VYHRCVNGSKELYIYLRYKESRGGERIKRGGVPCTGSKTVAHQSFAFRFLYFSRSLFPRFTRATTFFFFIIDIYRKRPSAMTTPQDWWEKWRSMAQGLTSSTSMLKSKTFLLKKKKKN